VKERKERKGRARKACELRQGGQFLQRPRSDREKRKIRVLWKVGRDDDDPDTDRIG
jgi:hypothetical protein